MKRSSLAAGLVIGVTVLSLCGFAGTAWSQQCPKTQGEFALDLAQLLGSEVTTQEQAKAALERRGIQPLEGWKLGVLLTPAVAGEVDHAVVKAIKEMLVLASLADGAVAAALESIGCRDFIAGLPGRWIPVDPWVGTAGGRSRTYRNCGDLSSFRPCN